MSTNFLPEWGLVGYEGISSIRRARTLQVGMVVKSFNDLAVPGMGNVWYGKQIFLAALGLAVAEKARERNGKVNNIEVANAIEAIACLLSFKSNNWGKDPRLRGVNKLKFAADSLSFSNVRKAVFYVTQPMRMATVQPLVELDIVNNNTYRFNSFELTAKGAHMVAAISASYGNIFRSTGLIDYLINWVLEKNSEIKNVEKIKQTLSQCEKLSPANCRLLERFLLEYGGDEVNKKRRKDIFEWVDMDYLTKQGHLSWNKKPNCLSPEHWQDLKAGAYFFKTRDLALELLNHLEDRISQATKNKLSIIEAKPKVKKQWGVLSKAAQAFLDLQYDRGPAEEATLFCRECVNGEVAIRRLVERDALGLRLRYDMVVPGPAFKGRINQSNDYAESDDDLPEPNFNSIKLPPNISRRVKNMFFLNQDLNGKLNKWL